MCYQNCKRYTYRKAPLGRPGRRWEDNFIMDIKEIGINTKNWIDTAQDSDYWRALVNAELSLWIA
jgi:hypothetical protein